MVDKNNTYNKVIIAMFISIIFIIGVSSIIIKDKEFSDNENKVMAKLPSFNIDDLLSGKYNKDVENYFSDHIVLRDSFISYKTLTEIAMGKKDNSRVYFGEDNMLMEIHKKIDYNVLKENTDIINKYNDFLNTKYNVNMDLMIVNTKTSIYSERLPQYANVNNENKVIKYINENTNTKNINVSNTLIKNKNKDIYFDLDHHWNSYGAYLAYLEYAKIKGYETKKYTKEIVNNNFYGSLYSKAINPLLKPDKVDIVDINKDIKYNITYDRLKTTSNVYEYSNLDKKDKYTFYLDGNHAEVTINTNNKNNKTMVIFKDSFAHTFIPFLVKDYEKIIILDLRYIGVDLNLYFKENNVTDVLMLYNIYNFSNKNEFVKLKNYTL